MQVMSNLGASLSRFVNGKPKPPTAYESMMELLNIVTRVALGILAAKAAPALFAPCVLVGVAWGLNYSVQYGDHHSHAAIHPSGCGQGFMESVAGMHFPPELTVIANLGITLCHLDHHPAVFVPYCAVAVGMWMGQQAAAPFTKSVQWLNQQWVSSS